MNENIVNSDITKVQVDGKEYIIVGTAHISQHSADIVRETIEQEAPDTVCVELDKQRFTSLKDKKKWENLDLKEVIKNKQLSALLINILLASYQKKMGEQLGVKPGLELLEAVNTAESKNINVELVDRDVRITLRRAWHSMSLWQKVKFMSVGAVSVFEKEEISEEKLKEIRQKDVLNEMLQELGKAMPVLKRVLIDERDTYIAEKMKQAEGKKIVSVVGAGHVEGIVKKLESNDKPDLKVIEKIPPVSPWVKIIGWLIPVIILGSILYIGLDKGMGEAGQNALFWVLANGIPSAIGGIIALGHPLTIIGVFIAAPFTSLTPVIGAGYVAAFIQAYFAPPKVKEFETVTDDFNSYKKWWQNKLLRILLVFILTGLGSLIGSYVGAYEIISNLLS